MIPVHDEELENPIPSDDSIETPAAEPDADSSQVEKKGFFKRLISSFRTSSKPDETEHTSTDRVKSDLGITEKKPSLLKIAEKPSQ